MKYAQYLLLVGVLMLVMVGVASAATPYRLIGAIVIVDQRNVQVESTGVNLPAENATVCEAMKTAIVANGFAGGNYDYKNTIQRTYSLTCVNTTATPAP